MLNLLKAAETLGYETLPMLATVDHLKESHLPAIVNWRGYHWMVIYKSTDEEVAVADPGQGLIKMTMEEFLEGWTRYTLYLKPTEQFEEVEEEKPTLQQFLPYIQPYRRLLLEIGLASLALQVFSLLLPMFTKFILDEVIIKEQVRWLSACLIGVSGVVVLHLALGFCRQQLLLHVIMRVNLLMVSNFYKHVLSRCLFLNSGKSETSSAAFRKTRRSPVSSPIPACRSSSTCLRRCCMSD